MGKPLLDVSYSNDYEVGWANHFLEISYSMWLLGGMGKPLLDVSYSSDYEVGWANHS